MSNHGIKVILPVLQQRQSVTDGRIPDLANASFPLSRTDPLPN